MMPVAAGMASTGMRPISSWERPGFPPPQVGGLPADIVGREARCELGGVPIVSSSGCRRACLVEGAVAEHGVQDVDAASREADQGGVVLLAGGAFAVVVGA